MKFTRIRLHVLAGNGAQDFFDHPELFVFVVDHEITFVAELGDVPAQNPNAQGMKRTHRRLQRLAVITRGPFGDELVDAL